MRRLTIALFAGVFLAVTSCGTILYPERRTQPAGKLDSDIVILDAIGLIFFLVPGVVAFAVDFATGAIYLPNGEKSHVSEIFGAVEVRDPYVTIQYSDQLAAWLSSRTGQDVSLTSSDLVWVDGERCTTRVFACLTQWNTVAKSAAPRLADRSETRAGLP